MYTATRYHDISCGHRVVGHEGKCRHLHGHNYRIHFFCRPTGMVQQGQNIVRRQLDQVGRVVDFSVIKRLLCEWLEENFDHRMLIWSNDPDRAALEAIDETVVIVNFNPTAENIAKFLVEDLGPIRLEDTGVELYKVVVEETRKCSASYELE